MVWFYQFQLAWQALFFLSCTKLSQRINQTHSIQIKDFLPFSMDVSTEKEEFFSDALIHSSKPLRIFDFIKIHIRCYDQIYKAFIKKYPLDTLFSIFTSDCSQP